MSQYLRNKNKVEPLLSLEAVLADGRLRQAQLKMFHMLQAVDAVCTKYGLDYWLDAGTLLGAVRHQGFIPWDDDMDIGMTRESYEAFLRIAPNELPKHIWLQTPETDRGYYNLGAPLKIRDRNSYYLEKHELGTEPYVQGIFIDVFVYDKLPSNPKLRHQNKLIAKKLLRILGTKYSKVPMGHYATLYRFIGSFIPKTWLKNFLERIINNSKRLDTPFLGRGYQCKMTNLIHFNDVYPLKKIRFESGEFNVFNKTDTFLREQYGDYMTLPPETYRRIRHCKALIPNC